MRHVFYANLFKQLRNLHPREQCLMEVCVLHNPTRHRMTTWPVSLELGTGVILRHCIHGSGHADPDSLQWYIAQNGLEPSHWEGKACAWGCDGCCEWGAR